MKFYFCLLYGIGIGKIKVVTTLKILNKGADIKTKTTNSMRCLKRFPRDLFKSNVTNCPAKRHRLVLVRSTEFQLGFYH